MSGGGREGEGEMEMDRHLMSSAGHVRRMAAHSKAIQGESQALLAEARAAVDDVRGAVVENPWGAALAAMGLGYVLGGGLFTRTTARLLCLGARAVLLPAMEDRLSRAVSEPME